ncbi:MAG: hypothetical protein KatS3mg009_3393 [Acidimicrobiia bacterium]|nr:MAG: hypothetical protein KatS3mg009_3393 [Acidimicrobiia bacterium]
MGARIHERRGTLNVLWILCDELRTDALGCYGGAPVPVRTPHIDALAGRGVLFERCYANSPVCVPARVSMHTGLLAEATGVYHNEAYAPGYPMEPVVTFPELFARAGWATADFGKEHVPRVLRPWQVQDPSGSLMPEVFWAVPDVSVLDLVRSPTGGVVAGRFPATVRHPGTAVVDNVLAWIATAPQPFLVRASFLQPHAPVVPPEPWSSCYDDAPWPDEVRVDPGACAFERRFGEICGAAAMPARDLVRAQSAYHGTVAWIDSEIGRLLAGLDALGVADRTAIVFTADHGHLLGEQGAIGKHTHAPAAQRIPLVVVHPDLAPARRSDLVQQIDLPRTMCALAGVEVDVRIGGHSVFATRDAEPTVFSTIGYGEPQSHAFPNLGVGRWFGDRGWPRRSCVRRGRWRLDRNVRVDGAPASGDDVDAFLADSVGDPDEVVNRIDDPAVADVARELAAALDALAASAVETPAETVYGTALPGTG